MVVWNGPYKVDDGECETFWKDLSDVLDGMRGAFLNNCDGGFSGLIGGRKSVTEFEGENEKNGRKVIDF